MKIPALLVALALGALLLPAGAAADATATWGAALQALGLAPKDLDGVVRQSLRR